MSICTVLGAYFQMEKKDGTNHQQPPQMELGQFTLTWDAGTTE